MHELVSLLPGGQPPGSTVKTSAPLKIDDFTDLQFKNFLIKLKLLQLNSHKFTQNKISNIQMSKNTLPKYLIATSNGYCVDIPQFYKHVDGLPRGLFFQEIRYLTKMVDNHWEITYIRNSNGWYRKFYEMMVKLHKNHGVKHPFQLLDKDKKFRNAGKSRHAVAQALGDVFSFPKRVSDLIRDSNIAVNTMNHAAMTLEQMLQHVTQSIEDMKAWFQQQKQTMGKLVDILMFIGKICSVCYILSNPANRNIKTIVALLTLIIPSSTTGVQTFVAGLIRAIEGMSGVHAQEGDDQSGFLSSFFSLTVGIIKGLFNDIPQDAFNSMNLSSKKIKLVSDYIRGATTIFEFITRIVEKFFNFIGDKLLKHYGILPWFLKEDGLNDIIDEYTKMKDEKHDMKCAISKESAQKVVRLYEKLYKMEASLNKKVNKYHAPNKILPYMRIMLKTMEGLVNKIPDHLRSGLAPRRTKPFWVYLYGEPRVGKSAVIQPYIVNVLAKSLGLITKYEDYTNYTYLRNCGEEYWEGYDGHPVLWYNDLFQNYAEDEAMHSAVMELTNVVDDNVYPLNMAFERKHGVYFNSELVISNAQDEMLNQTFISNKCWSGGAHLYARRNVCINLVLNNKYRKKCGVGINEQVLEKEMRDHPDRCVGYEFVLDPTNAQELKDKLLFPEDMYWMKFTDPNDGSLQALEDLRSGMARLSELAIAYKDTQGQFKERLYNHFERLFTQGETDDEDESEEDDEYVFREPEPQRRKKQPRTTTEATFDEPPLEEQQGEKSSFALTSPDTWFDAVEEIPFRLHVAEVTETVRHNISAMFPELIGDYHYGRKNFVNTHTSNDFGGGETCDHGFVWTWEGKNVDEIYQQQTQFKDMRMRVILAVEITGGKEWYKLSQQQGFWQKLKNKLKYGWDDIYTYFYNLNAKLPHFLQIQNLLMTFIWSYSLYRCIRFYYDFLTGYQYSIYKAETTKSIGTDTSEDAKNEQVNDKNVSTTEATITPIALTAEGNNKVAVKQIVRKKMVKGATTQAYDVQNVNIENVVQNSMCKFSMEVYDGSDVLAASRVFGSGLCVGSDIFVLPHHFYARWAEMHKYYTSFGHDFRILLTWNEKLKQSIPWDNLEFFQLDYEHSADLVFLRIKNLVQKQHLKKFFISVNDKPTLYDMYLYGYKGTSNSIHTMHVSGAEYTSTQYEQHSQPDPLYGGKWENRMVCVPKCIQYWDCQTAGGDCGMLLFNSDSALNCRKIMGLHTGGQPSCAYGLGSILYKEDIEEAFDHFYKDQEPIRAVALEFEPVDTERTKELKELGLLVCGQLPRLVEPEFKVDKQPMVTLPRRSKISKSVTYDIMAQDFGPATTAPARLRPFKVNDTKVSPILLGLKKMVKVSPVVPRKYCDEIVNHMSETIKSWRSPYQPRLLTDDEVVNGFGLLNPVEMSTSAGYPYVFLDNTAGKHPFFEVVSEAPRKYVMGKYLKSHYDLRIAMAKKGLIKTTYFIDTLKDETRPLAKVEVGKTRVFQLGPVDLNLVMRKYFGMFVCHMQSTYLEGESAVGINANSTDWTHMLKKQIEIAEPADLGMLNGDGENFDASAGQPMGMCNVEVINQWYDDDYENQLIRRVLFATFLNSLHIYGDIVYIALQGNKSGIFLTTIFNNLTGMFAIRLSMKRAGYELHLFSANVRPKFFGDDDNTAINKRNLPLLTCKHHKQTMAMLGIVYTSATKGEIVDTWYSVAEVSFLKRKFVWDSSLRLYLPQLDLDVIYEIARWSESDPDNMVDQLNRFNSSLLEVSNYGKERFAQLRSRYVEYCILLKNQGYVIKPQDLFSFAYCEQIKFNLLEADFKLLPVSK